ncbi:MAG: SAM-dependent methyltransferase [Flavobacteriales bacterium]|mgnify:CR=1 FL=1|nr:SAM-dependent methyltransferase [Flavobacteriales bacterium]|tara:strand:- start:259 stop:912 length:654 start_codon:yes stop_codon:yes gene_type:complete
MYKVIKTNDGSFSLFDVKMKESYHSKHGAIKEAKHVFLKNGLLSLNKDEIAILEIGFGTGLNTLLTLKESKKNNININYHTLEPYPISQNMYNILNYHKILGMEKQIFLELHNIKWNEEKKIDDFFILKKIKKSIQMFNAEKKYDLVYFDAFSPKKQPELWKPDILRKIFFLLKNNGFLVTYCAQGKFKRNLKEIGYQVISLDGPPGKREMIKAIRK